MEGGREILSENSIHDEAVSWVGGFRLITFWSRSPSSILAWARRDGVAMY